MFQLSGIHCSDMMRAFACLVFFSFFVLPDVVTTASSFGACWSCRVSALVHPMTWEGVLAARRSGCPVVKCRDLVIFDTHPLRP